MDYLVFKKNFLTLKYKKCGTGFPYFRNKNLEPHSSDDEIF